AGPAHEVELARRGKGVAHDRWTGQRSGTHRSAGLQRRAASEQARRLGGFPRRNGFRVDLRHPDIPPVSPRAMRPWGHAPIVNIVSTTEGTTAVSSYQRIMTSSLQSDN